MLDWDSWETCVLILPVATDLPSELEHIAPFGQNFLSISKIKVIILAVNRIVYYEELQLQ